MNRKFNSTFRVHVFIALNLCICITRWFQTNFSTLHSDFKWIDNFNVLYSFRASVRMSNLSMFLEIQLEISKSPLQNSKLQLKHRLGATPEQVPDSPINFHPPGRWRITDDFEFTNTMHVEHSSSVRIDSGKVARLIYTVTVIFQALVAWLCEKPPEGGTPSKGTMTEKCWRKIKSWRWRRTRRRRRRRRRKGRNEWWQV